MAKAPKKKAATKPAAGAGDAPTIDTNLAAEAAAKLVAAKVGTGGSNAPAKESSSFKNLKQSVSNPASTTMANLLDSHALGGSKKSNQPFGGGKQVGRNQTFGADVNRTGVPRRTGGG